MSNEYELSDDELMAAWESIDQHAKGNPVLLRCRAVIAAALAKREAIPSLALARSSEPVTLNGWQLCEALEFVNPDGDRGTEQLDCDIGIRYQSVEVIDQETGDRYPPGYYAHLAEYPEEGSIYLEGVCSKYRRPQSTGAGMTPRTVELVREAGGSKSVLRVVLDSLPSDEARLEFLRETCISSICPAFQSKP